MALSLLSLTDSSILLNQQASAVEALKALLMVINGGEGH